jgi:hypothetical protein
MPAKPPAKPPAVAVAVIAKPPRQYRPQSIPDVGARLRAKGHPVKDATLRLACEMGNIRYEDFAGTRRIPPEEEERIATLFPVETEDEVA